VTSTDRRESVLVLRALGLGDLLTAVPALRGLRAALPEHRLVLATPRALAPLAGLTGAVDAVLPTAGLERGLAWPGPPPEVAVNLHGRGPRSHRLLGALDPGRLEGFANAETGSDGPRWNEAEHEVLRWCRLVAGQFRVACDPDALDLDVPPLPGPELPAPPAPPPGSPLGRDAGIAVVHPGAAYPSRRWPAERFAVVARALAGRGLSVAVTGSEAEAGLARSVAVEAGLDGEAVLAGRTGALDLAALVASASVVVSGDTGVAHLASAYRRPSVVLFGPVPPSRWGPPADRPEHVALWHGTGAGDPWGDTVDEALLRITVPEVLAAVDQVLVRTGAGAGARGSGR
jgi:ADP-heptose:LPS heptosyltransferase